MAWSSPWPSPRLWHHWQGLTRRSNGRTIILLDGRKVAGILVEIRLSGPNAGALILGIGINVSQERFVGAEGFVYPPTSLRLATGRP